MKLSPEQQLTGFLQNHLKTGQMIRWMADTGHEREMFAEQQVRVQVKGGNGGEIAQYEIKKSVYETDLEELEFFQAMNGESWRETHLLTPLAFFHDQNQETWYFLYPAIEGENLQDLIDDRKKRFLSGDVELSREERVRFGVRVLENMAVSVDTLFQAGFYCDLLLHRFLITADANCFFYELDAVERSITQPDFFLDFIFEVIGLLGSTGLLLEANVIRRGLNSIDARDAHPDVTFSVQDDQFDAEMERARIDLDYFIDRQQLQFLNEHVKGDQRIWLATQLRVFYQDFGKEGLDFLVKVLKQYFNQQQQTPNFQEFVEGLKQVIEL